MRIIFMGTPEFAVPSLERLVENGYTPVAVVTGPDRKRGRGQRVSVTAVKAAAQRMGIEMILQPESVKDPAFAEELAALEPDLIVIVAFKILPPAVFMLPRLGSFNLHGSLLPRYRGAAPINRAIMAGDTETGVSTFFLKQKVDTGNMILQRSMPVGPEETAGEVHDRMMEIGADVVLETVQLIEAGKAPQLVQDNSLATPAPKIFKDDCQIPWSAPAEVVHNHIRGLSPYPGAWTQHEDVILKIYRSRPTRGSGKPGTVLKSDDGLRVACGEGAVEILEVQQQGRRRLDIDAFMRGYTVQSGDRLD